MANTIIDDGGDLQVEMVNARFARAPLPAIFSGWTTLRVGLYLKIEDSGANVTGTIRFAFGLCAGDTNIPGDATCTHFAGCIAGSSPWTRATGPIRYSGSNYFPAKIVNTTTTFGTTLGGTIWQTQNLQILFVEITKGSPNYSFRVYGRSTATADTTPTLSDFYAAMSAGSPSGTGMTYFPAQTVAVDEGADGTFDNACVWWNQTNPPMNIAAWQAYRIA
jgi:hypothetical protein